MQTLQIVAVLLSVGTIVGPVVFAGVLWRMSKIFVSRDAFDDYKIVRHDAHNDLCKRLDIMEQDIKELLTR